MASREGVAIQDGGGVSSCDARLPGVCASVDAGVAALHIKVTMMSIAVDGLVSAKKDEMTLRDGVAIHVGGSVWSGNVRLPGMHASVDMVWRPCVGERQHTTRKQEHSTDACFTVQQHFSSRSPCDNNAVSSSDALPPGMRATVEAGVAALYKKTNPLAGGNKRSY
jgi:hypothetical protein